MLNVLKMGVIIETVRFHIKPDRQMHLPSQQQLIGAEQQLPSSYRLGRTSPRYLFTHAAYHGRLTGARSVGI